MRRNRKNNSPAEAQAKTAEDRTADLPDSVPDAGNGERVRQLRNEGRTDEEIADSILAAMGSTSGYKHNLAKKKLVIYLVEFK